MACADAGWELFDFDYDLGNLVGDMLCSGADLNSYGWGFVALIIIVLMCVTLFVWHGICVGDDFLF